MPSVTFRYILNGNTVTFTNQVDIDSMKGHPDYVRVEEQVAAAPVVTEEPKKPGRPKKTETPIPEAE